ncbi:BatD family protein [Thermodesulfobacteriota bacterium]
MKRYPGRAFLIIFVILMLPVFVQAAKIQASVDRTRITAGESLQLTVTVSGKDADVDISPIKDFQVISKGSSSSVRMVNTQISREVGYNYILIPLKEGRLKIPPLTVKADGKTHQTREIVIQVSKQAQGELDTQDVFVKAHISEQHPYEGQQIVYTFALYNAVQLSKNARFQEPDFAGFNPKKVEDEKTYTTILSGRQYSVVELRYVLVPLKEGNATIGPAVLRCDIVRAQKRRRRSLFDDPFFGGARLEPRIFKTDPIAVNIKPLPAYTGDIQFSGLVGRVEVQAKLDKTELTVGDSTTLSITVQGTGNIMDAEEPAVNVPEAFKVYKDNPEERIQLEATGYSGEKVFRLALVATKAGIYALEPIQIVYFDVSKNRYADLSTPPFQVRIYPSVEKDDIQVYASPKDEQPPEFKKKKVEFTGRDILPLKEELDALESQRPMSLPRFIIFLLVPVFFYMAVVVVFMFILKQEDLRSIMAERADRLLKKATHIEVSADEFLSCLHKAVISAVFSKAGVKGESLTYAEAEEILRSSGYADETAKQAAQLLEKIESTKYSGLMISSDSKEELLSETKQLFRSLS